MKIKQFNKSLNSAIRKNWVLSIALIVIFIAIILRVNSHKYSLDTAFVFFIFQSILFDQSTFLPSYDVSFLNIHFTPLYILISPLYFLGPTLLIFSWKFLCYGGFLLILWRMIKDDQRNNISNWHKNLFLLLILLHPAFVANLISPDIWNSDLIFPLLGLSILYVNRKKYSWAVFWFCITFLIKEDMMLVGFLYGLFLAFHTKKAGFIWLSIFSLIWFFMSNF